MGKLKSVGRYVMEDQTLGKGNFAVVELGRHIITKMKVAIKIIDRRKICEEYMQRNLFREARVLGQLRHPNVIRLYETITSSALYFIVTEYVGGGDLLSFVRNQRDGRLAEPVARPFVRQLVSALHHLHERGIVHRDLKMENIILDDKKCNLKIIDFGLSNHFQADQLLKTHCGSPEYAAPELFVSGREYGPEVDIWSFGVIFYAMVIGKLPFTAPRVENRRQKLLLQINAGLGRTHEKDLKYITPDCSILLHQCIEPNSVARIHLLDIHTHPWITQNGTDPFYTFQQPSKDPAIKAMILQKMTSILGCNRAKLEVAVHEFRADEFSAIFNMLLHEQLRIRGLWEGDHTRRKRTSPKTSRSHCVTHVEDREDDSPDACEDGIVRMKSPTIIGMVRPSERTSDTRNLYAADFELSIVNSQNSKSTRPRTATFLQSCLYSRPLGNATTVNMIIARNQQRKNTPSLQSTQQNRRVTLNPSSCPSTPNHHLLAPYPSAVEMQSPLTASNGSNPVENKNLPNQDEDPSKSCEKDDKSGVKSEYSEVAKDNHENTEVINPSDHPDSIRVYQKAKGKQLTKKNTPISRCKHVINTPKSEEMLDAGKRKVGVVDMGHYFSNRHGYHTQETPIMLQNGNQVTHVSQKGGIFKNSTETEKHKRKTSFKLCDDHRDQLQEMNSRQWYEFKSNRSSEKNTPHTDANVDGEERKTPTPIKITLQHDDSRAGTHEKWHQLRTGGKHKQKSFHRKYKIAAKGAHSKSASGSRSVRGIGTGSAKSEQLAHQGHEQSQDGDFQDDYEEERWQRGRNSECLSPRSILRTPVASLQSRDNIIYALPPRTVTTDRHPKNGTSGKDNDKLGMPQRLEWKRTHSADLKIRRGSLAAKRDTSQITPSNGIKQRVPDETIRVNSEKLRTLVKGPVWQGPKPRKERHMTLAASQRHRMLKYGGYVMDDNDSSPNAFDNLSRFSTQGITGVLLTNPNLVSNENENEGGKISLDVRKLLKSAVVRHNFEKHPKIHCWSFNSEDKSVSLKPHSKPVVQPKTESEPTLFDVGLSHDVTSVQTALEEQFKNSAKICDNETDWEKTYNLERKVSDTIKGGSDITRLRRTPESMSSSY